MTPRVRIELAVPRGGFEVALAWHTDESALGLFGPSGAGKTTILESLAGLRREARGRIEIAGRTWLDSRRGIRLPPERRGVGYVPQDLLLFPHLDVLGNLRLAERRGGAAPKRLEIDRVLELLELAALAHRPVDRLSGGERQRVAIGRALCSAPELLLLDEPLASLDHSLRRRILPYLVRVREEFSVPTIHVSHDPTEMSLLAREISVLERGRVVARGGPEEVFAGHGLGAGRPAGEIVNLFLARIEEVTESLAYVSPGAGVRFAIADDGLLRPGERVAVELRATEVLIARGAIAGLSAQNVIGGVVREVHLPAGGDPHAAAVVATAIPGVERPLAAVVSRRAVAELGLGVGAEVRLIFKAQACRVVASC